MYAGVGILEFWDLTPRETYLAIDAALWQTELQQKSNLTLAWHMAALSRSKNLPSLKSLLAAASPAKPLRGTELVKRRDEFARTTKTVDGNRIAEKHKERLQHGISTG